ncbi:hypothetical protein [Tomitella cavernea]|uniref:Terminase n=1 Tax=Tomitella cavernea TaxID=1387982 RepID=A0ABP9CL06_9ACTN|nr:hypothetical protein [Tomitella cavernea]
MRSPQPELSGWQQPRFRNVPDYVDSLADEVLDLAAVVGRVQIPWQIDATTDFMGVGRDGRWSASKCAILCARQNGKNGIAENMELGWLVLEPGVRILHTAHEMPAAINSMNKLVQLLEAHPDLRAMIPRGGVRRRGGEEGIKLRNGSSIMFRTRTDSVARSFSFDRVVIDEAMIYSPESRNAIAATMTTGKNPQTIYLGSAPNFLEHPNCEIWSSIIRAGRSGADPTLAYVEYSAPEDADPGAQESILRANPSTGYLTSFGYLHGEFESARALGESGIAGYKVERLSIPVFPPDPEEAAAHEPIADMTCWDAGEIGESFSPPVTGASALGVARDWGGEMTAVVSAAFCEDESVHLEVGAAGAPNTHADVEFLAGAVDLQDPVAVAMDAKSPTTVLEPGLLLKGIEAVKSSAGEMGQACLMLVTWIAEGRITHSGDPLLTEPLALVKKRPIGTTGAWGLDWRCEANIAPLVAAALALWALVTRSAQAPDPQPPAPAGIDDHTTTTAWDSDDEAAGTSFLATAGF